MGYLSALTHREGNLFLAPRVQLTFGSVRPRHYAIFRSICSSDRPLVSGTFLQK
jgi:hypothetical protein